MSGKKPCHFFAKGRCTNGSLCRFSHDFVREGVRQQGGENFSKSTREGIKINRKQLIIRNLNPNTTEREVKRWFLELTEEVPFSIKFHHDNTAAMAGFQTALDFDSLKIKLKSEKRLHLLNGNKIELDGVPFCRRILLWGIPIDTSKDEIEHWLRQIMGPTSIDNIDFVGGTEFAIVNFKKTDLTNLRKANLVFKGKKLSYHYYDENFVTKEIYDTIHGKTMKIRLMIKNEILDYILKKRKDSLEFIVETSNFTVESNDQVCYLVVTIDDWYNAIEKRIRDDFSTFISEYDSAQIFFSPESLKIIDIHEFFSSFQAVESKQDVIVQLKHDIICITGERKEVQESAGRCDKLKTDMMKLKKKKEQSSVLRRNARLILQNYPVFTKDDIIDWLKAAPNGFNADTTKVESSSKTYAKKDELSFFETEAFKNCRHRILKDCCVVLAKEKMMPVNNVATRIEVAVDDISNVESDVIVNSSSNKIGSGKRLAQSLNDAAGSAYISEWKARFSESIDYWNYKRTTGGNLKCKEVFHVNLGSYDATKFLRLLEKIFNDAASSSYNSIALPMLGTGERKYSKEEVAKNLVKSVENFNDANPHKFLWKVIVVVEENDRDSLMALKKHVKDRRVVSESVQITLLGVRKEDVNEADGILERCLNEQTVKSNEAVSLPSHWDKMPIDADGKEVPFHYIPLLKTSEEFKKVQSELLRTSSGKITKIQSICRLQNPKLYMSYMIKKQAMDKRNGPRNNERYLFHGTSKESTDAISHHGFNRSYAGKHAASFGNGNYFAVNSSYAIDYAKPEAGGKRHMYMAKVLVGEYTQGIRGMVTPPKKGRGTDLYDSVVNDETNPTIFVVFPDDHAYPEYLISSY